MQKLLFAVAVGLLTLTVAAELAARKVQGPSATFVYSRGHGKASVLRRPAQMFALQPEVGICKKLRFISGFGSFNGPSQSNLMPAGSPINLYAQNMILLESGPYQRVEGRCAASVTFTPIIGAKYQIKQMAEQPGVCDLTVFDEATGAAPPDMVVNQVRPCGGYM